MKRTDAKPSIVTSSFAASLACAGLAIASLPVHAADGPVEQVVVRSTAHFDFNRASIRPHDQAAILAEVAKMQGVTWQTVKATGHTDSIGSDTYNEKLSANRAAAVKSYLVSKGLDPAMINTEAKAEAAPLADNDSPTGRAKNRRTEIEFQGVRTVSK